MAFSLEDNSARTGKCLGAEEISFYFDGRKCHARTGDTAASALLANGIILLGRSVKYRRRRGLLSANSDEPNALITLGSGPDRIPNIQATRLVIKPQMELFSQNRWPSLHRDITSIIGLGGRFFSVGFYYKTFFWPSWRSFEGIIRRLAGLGKAPEHSNLPLANRQNLICDTLVAGAGPAGLITALNLARAGKSVVICESAIVCGGQLDFETATIDGMEGEKWTAYMVHQLIEAGVKIFMETDLISARPGLAIAHHEPCGFPGNGEQLLHIHAKTIIFATGAHEFPIIFAGNDLPRCMLLGAAELFFSRYGVLPGQNTVIFGNNDRVYESALRLLNGGLKIAAVVDTRSNSDSIARTSLLDLAIPCVFGSSITLALGRLSVEGAKVSSHDNSRSQVIACDTILSCGGWTPSAKLSEPIFKHSAIVAIGAANGNFTLDAVFQDSKNLVAALVGENDFETPGVTRADPAPKNESFWRSKCVPALEKKQFVDFQNDVTVADLRQSVEEGFLHIEHAKRYTALGFGTEQGRTSKTPGSEILREFNGSSEVSEISRPRRPYRSVSLSALSGWRSGDYLRPVRRTPMTGLHESRNAVMQPTGLWLRPHYFLANGSSAAEAGYAEAQRVRTKGGITDASTLSKIEITGPDAAAFIDRICLTKASKLAEGRGKYAMLLREDGMVLDDGLMVRIAPERFLLMTSTGHAGMVLSHLEYWHELEWFSRSVTLTDVTDSWAVIVLAGSQSQSAMLSLFGKNFTEQISVMKHMDYAEFSWLGQTVRILRASFSGEWAYELYARPDIAPKIWAALLDLGYEPYGLEALDILRVEKGYFTGAEINGQTTAEDLGFGALFKFNQDCIGADMIGRPGLQDKGRARIFGIQSLNTIHSFFAGAHITGQDDTISIGHITSAASSPALGGRIGLALISGCADIQEKSLVARDPVRGIDCPVSLTNVCQFDISGERMK